MLKFVLPEHVFSNSSEKIINKIVYPSVKDLPIGYSLPEFDIKTPHMIIMCGYPGSGKSRLSKYIENQYANTKPFVIVSQDILQTKTKCKELTKKLIANESNIIIDNTNPDTTSRHEYINLCKNLSSQSKYTIICMNMTTSYELSMHNNMYRNNISSKYIPTIVYNMYKKKYSKPELAEGFDQIYWIDPININTIDYLFYLY